MHNKFCKVQICRFSLSGRVIGAVGGESCPAKNRGPSEVDIQLLSLDGDVISHVLTSSTGKFVFGSVVPGSKAFLHLFSDVHYLSMHYPGVHYLNPKAIYLLPYNLLLNSQIWVILLSHNLFIVDIPDPNIL